MGRLLLLCLSGGRGGLLIGQSLGIESLGPLDHGGRQIVQLVVADRQVAEFVELAN